jgi:hypothetical protein
MSEYKNIVRKYLPENVELVGDEPLPLPYDAPSYNFVRMLKEMEEQRKALHEIAMGPMRKKWDD